MQTVVDSSRKVVVMYSATFVKFLQRLEELDKSLEGKINTAENWLKF